MKKRLRFAIIAFVGVPMILASSLSRAGMLATIVNFGGPRNMGYQGPLDIKTGATFAGGLRAMSHAKAVAGAALVNVCNVSDIACVDFVSDINGNVVVTTIGGSSCAIVTCTVKTIYDQSGSGHDATQATIASRFIFKTAAAGSGCTTASLPCMAAAGSAQYTITITSASQPYSYVAVAVDTAGAGGANIIGAAGTSNLLYFTDASTGATNCANAASPQITKAATNAVWHNFVGVCNSTSSVIAVDGSSATGNAGSFPSTTSIEFANNGAGALTGKIDELLMYPSDTSGTEITILCHNEYTYWTTSTSC